MPETVPFAAMEALPQGGQFDARFTNKPIEKLTSGTYFERGDILVAKITPSFENGKQALVRNLPSAFGYATTEVIPIRPKEAGRDPRFVFFYLLHPDVRSFIAEKMEGATGRQRVPDRVLMDLLVPDLSAGEERQIADVLEVTQRAISIESSVVDLTVRLKHTAMHDLYTRGLRRELQKDTAIGLIPESWNVIPLGSLGRVGNGSTPKRSIPAYWSGGTYPWLTSAKVYDREIVAADQFVTDVALDECHLPRISPGAVLIAITGQGKTLGHCAVLRFEATVNQHIAYVAVDPTMADPSFVRGYLETQYEYLRQVGSGGGSTKGALTCSFLRNFPIPQTASGDQLREQREIVAILDAIDQKIAIHRQKRAVLEELFDSLLHELISGKLRVSDLDLSALEQSATAVSA